MFGEIVQFCDFSLKLVYDGFYYSYKTGELLVSLLGYTLKLGLISCQGIVNFLHILIESLTIFLNDVAREIHQIYDILSSCATTLCCILERHYQYLVTVIFWLFYNISLFSELILAVLILCKDLVILFGDGVWFLVTLIPSLLYLTIVNILCAVNNIIINTVKTKTKDLYNFVTDIPYESLLGITIAFSLIYLFTQFYMIIFLYLYQQIRGVFRSVVRRTKALVRNLFRFLIKKASPEPRKRTMLRVVSPNKEICEDERFCVICHERSRCILLLPCRHMCLCSECSLRLELYSKNCPICRNNIENSLTVFI